MRIATSVKVALVGAFLTLLLSLFFTTEMASAHSANTLQSQTSVSSSVDSRDQAPCQTFTTVNQMFRGYLDPNTHQYIPSPVFNGGQPGTFVFVGNRRVFHRGVSASFERVTIVTICNGHRSQRIVVREI
jgi:hypothetical protein